MRTTQLPGVSFEVGPTLALGNLPRMDVTAFVGVSESGPFDTPILIEDPLRFREIFGRDVALTESSRDVEATYSLLGPSVESFFYNGGRSCWVVRVGNRSSAETSEFLVPGLVQLRDPADPSTFVPARVRGRSAGTGFDDQQVAGWLERATLPLPPSVPAFDANGGSVEISDATLAVGDMIEFSFDAQTLWVIVTAINDIEFGRTVASWKIDDEAWLRRPAPGDHTAGATATIATHTSIEPLTIEGYEVDDAGAPQLRTTSLLDRDPIGSVVRVRNAAGAIQVFTVDRVTAPIAVGYPQTLSSRGGWELLLSPPRLSAGMLHSFRRIGFGIGVFSAGSLLHVVRELSFSTQSPRWWGNLPSDDALFGRHYRRHAAGDEHPMPEPLDVPSFWPRTNVAASPGAQTAFPIGLWPDLDAATRGHAQLTSSTTAVRNGVDAFSADWFLDPELRNHGVETVAGTAQRRFFVDGEPLRGIHAIAPLSDVAVLAAPDAIHTGWDLVVPDPVRFPPAPSLRVDDAQDVLAWDAYPGPADATYEVESSTAADLLHAVRREQTDVQQLASDRTDCEPVWFRVRAMVGGTTSPWSNTVTMIPGQSTFSDCATTQQRFCVLSDPALGEVEWQLVPDPPVEPGAFELQISEQPLFDDADARRIRVDDVSLVIRAEVAELETGTRFIRVRHIRSEVAGPWSNTVFLEALLTQSRVAITNQDAVAATTLEVHRAMAALVASRADLTALISFPRTYGLGVVAEHVAALRVGGQLTGSGLSSWSDYLHAHYPWVAGSFDDGTTWLPPDGVVAGRLAETALRRGAWVAAVQLPLAKAVATEPLVLIHDALGLRHQHVNTLGVRAAGPANRGIHITGVDTLSLDPAVLPVTVRRLLILLRRLVLREGHAMVFENNGPLLWRIVRLRFETVLGELFRRGAFAGRSPNEAFRVICDGTVNTERTMDAGWVVVDIQVAPAHPLEFLTVRFIQSDAAGFFAEAA